MQTAIRFVGILNAAIWLGAVVCFTVVVGPAFFSAEMATVMPRAHASRAVEVVLERLYSLQMICAFVALGHLGVEYFHCGRPLRRLSVGLLTLLLGLNLVGAFWLLPRMHQLQGVRYSSQTSEEQKAAAARQFGRWHGVSQAVNVLVLGVLVFHVWSVTRPLDMPRFVSWDKFRG